MIGLILVQRPYTCPVDDCHSSYRRKDHLTRHLLRHKGKLFKCPVESCSLEFSFQSNMKRHMKEFHYKDCSSPDAECQKQHICREIGCGKVFRFASKLRKHEDSHGKLAAFQIQSPLVVSGYIPIILSYLAVQIFFFKLEKISPFFYWNSFAEQSFFKQENNQSFFSFGIHSLDGNI